MRQLASFLLVALAVPAVAADVWRWRDANGVVHFSDQPTPGAERIKMPETPEYTGPSTSQAVQAAPPPVAVKFAYTECVIAAPGNDQVFNNVNSVTVSVQIKPPLLQDDRVQVVLDGLPYAAWPARMLTSKLNDIHRGTHKVSVVVLDAANKPVCEGPPISFHVQQPSLLSPARKAIPVPTPAKPPAKP